MEDVKLLRRNLRACLQEVTSSLLLFMLARSALQMMKYFSHRHKLQRFEAGLKGTACFKIFQVKLNLILASFRCQMCLLSSVLSLLFGSLKEDLIGRVSGLKRVHSKACIGLSWPVVLRCYCGLEPQQIHPTENKRRTT